MVLNANLHASRCRPSWTGMDKAEALAYVSRLFDAAQVGAAVWGDALLIKRFITQCSRTDSEATRAAYRFEIKEFCRWRQRQTLHLRIQRPQRDLQQG